MPTLDTSKGSLCFNALTESSLGFTLFGLASNPKDLRPVSLEIWLATPLGIFQRANASQWFLDVLVIIFASARKTLGVIKLRSGSRVFILSMHSCHSWHVGFMSWQLRSSLTCWIHVLPNMAIQMLVPQLGLGLGGSISTWPRTIDLAAWMQRDPSSKDHPAAPCCACYPPVPLRGAHGLHDVHYPSPGWLPGIGHRLKSRSQYLNPEMLWKLRRTRNQANQFALKVCWQTLPPYQHGSQHANEVLLRSFDPARHWGESNPLTEKVR